MILEVEFPVVLDKIFDLARKIAIDKKRREVDIDILFHSFLYLAPYSTQSIFLGCNFDYELLRDLSQEVLDNKKPNKRVSSHLNDECNSVLAIAVDIGKKLFFGGDYICPDALLLSFVKKYEPKALKLYWEYKGENNDSLVQYILAHCRHLDKVNSEFFSKAQHLFYAERESLDMFAENSILSKFAINLNSLASQGKFDSLIDFDGKLDELCAILCRKKKPNAVLIGQAGVGKTGCVSLLAQAIVEGKAPELLSNKVIYSLSLSSMVAGTEYRGQFEKRLEDFVNEIKKYENIILFIDEIHTLVGAGGGSSTSLEASNILKPALANGEISCIGATTPTEYNLTIKRDAALDRRFEKVFIKDPSSYKIRQIIPQICENYGKFHNVNYTAEFMDNLVDYCDSFYPKRHYPDKAVDVIDQCGATAKVKFWEFSEEEGKHRKIFIENASNGDFNEEDLQKMQEGMEKWGERVLTTKPEVTLEHLHNFFSSKNNPIFNIIENDFDILKREVRGQDEFLDNFNSAVLDCSYFDRGNKSFLFFGPSSSGKSFICKRMENFFTRGGAMVYYYNGIEFFQSNYKLNGFNQDSLCERVILCPNSIIIIDDIQKASHSFLSLLSQILKDQKMQMINGEIADFSNCCFIFTCEQKSSGKLGYSDSSDAAKPDIDSFFVSNVSNQIALKKMELQDYKKIVDFKLKEMKSHLEKRNKKIQFSEEDVDKIALLQDFKKIENEIREFVKKQRDGENNRLT